MFVCLACVTVCGEIILDVNCDEKSQASHKHRERKRTSNRTNRFQAEHLFRFFSAAFVSGRVGRLRSFSASSEAPLTFLKVVPF